MITLRKLLKYILLQKNMEEHCNNEPVPKGKNKPFKLLPSKEPLRVRDLPNESKKKKTSKSSGIGPMCIFIKEHGQKMCQRLEKLHKRQQNGLLDLTIVCQVGFKTYKHSYKMFMERAQFLHFKSFLFNCMTRVEYLKSTENHILLG